MSGVRIRILPGMIVFGVGGALCALAIIALIGIGFRSGDFNMVMIAALSASLTFPFVMSKYRYDSDRRAMWMGAVTALAAQIPYSVGIFATLPGNAAEIADQPIVFFQLLVGALIMIPVGWLFGGGLQILFGAAAGLFCYRYLSTLK